MFEKSSRATRRNAAGAITLAAGLLLFLPARAQFVQYALTGSVPAQNSLTAQIAEFQIANGMIPFSLNLVFDTQRPPVVQAELPAFQEYRYPAVVPSLLLQFGGYSFENVRPLFDDTSSVPISSFDESLAIVNNAIAAPFFDQFSASVTDLSALPIHPNFGARAFTSFTKPTNVVLSGIQYTSMTFWLSRAGLSMQGSGTGMLSSAAIPTAPNWADAALIRSLQFSLEVQFSGPSGVLNVSSMNFQDVDFNLVASVPEPAGWQLFLGVAVPAVALARRRRRLEIGP